MHLKISPGNWRPFCLGLNVCLQIYYPYLQLDITNRSIVGNRDFFDLNGEWNVIGFPNRRHVAYYTCCLEPYSDVTYYLIIRRKPLYHMFHLILPCIFITATTVLVFYLPAQSGEKVIIISLWMISYDDVIKWKHFPRYLPFVRGIHWSLVNSPHKGQWRGALMFSLICALNKWLSKQSWGWCFERPPRSLWRHCNGCC